MEIRTKFNLVHEKEWTGDTVFVRGRLGDLIFVRGTMFLGRHTTSGRADTRRKESKDYQSSPE
jgi:hypothetical protein